MKNLSELRNDELVKKYKSSKVISILMGVIYLILIIAQFYSYTKEGFKLSLLTTPLTILMLFIIIFLH